jgi:hypothetical protein
MIVRLVCLTAILFCGLASSADADSLGVDTDTLPPNMMTADSLRLEPVVPAPPDTAAVDTAAYEVSIGRLLIDDMQLDDTLDIILNTHGRELGAFDLKIAIDNPVVDIVDILPGELHEFCGWDYFNARPLNAPGRDDLPSAVWQVVALAQTVPGKDQPTCFGLDGSLVLARLVLSNEHVLETPDQQVPIFFFWEDCTDNTIANRTGNTLMLSRHVYDYYGAADPDQPRLFPSRIGVPAECIKTNVLNPMRRLVDFHNGGVEFKLNIEPLEPTDSTAPSAPSIDN